jgi:hypothetical protein
MKNKSLQLMVNYWYMIQQLRNRGNTEKRTVYLPMRISNTGLAVAVTWRRQLTLQSTRESFVAVLQNVSSIYCPWFVISIHWVSYLCYYLVAYSHGFAGGGGDEGPLCKDKDIDRPVIMLYAAAVVLYAAGAAFFYFKWINDRGKE